jgi:hypothetical protein
MFAKPCVCILGCALVACGGRTDKSGLSAGATGTSAAVGETTGGSTLVGGSGSGGSNSGGAIGSGGAGGGDNCPSTTVNFQVVPSPNSTASWCMGTPSSMCGGVELTILDAAGPLELSNLCQVDCQTCARTLCPPMPCLQPQALTSSGIALAWSGMYQASASCGSPSTTCATARCAAPGQYQAKVCGFVNPTPGSADGCYVSSKPDFACVQVSFDYPPTDSASIVMAMPSQP